jgi:hypothetical protein
MYLAVICYFGANVLSIAEAPHIGDETLSALFAITISGPRWRADGQFLLFLVTIILCAIYCLLVSRVSERSNLVRILLSILGVLSAIKLLANAGNIFEQFERAPFVVAFAVGANCLQVAAVVLLLVPASRHWFRQTEAV